MYIECFAILFFIHIIVVPVYPGRVSSLFSILQPVYYYAGYHIVCQFGNSRFIY